MFENRLTLSYSITLGLMFCLLLLYAVPLTPSIVCISVFLNLLILHSITCSRIYWLYSIALFGLCFDGINGYPLGLHSLLWSALIFGVWIYKPAKERISFIALWLMHIALLTAYTIAEWLFFSLYHSTFFSLIIPTIQLLINGCIFPLIYTIVSNKEHS